MIEDRDAAAKKRQSCDPRGASRCVAPLARDKTFGQPLSAVSLAPWRGQGLRGARRSRPGRTAQYYYRTPPHSAQLGFIAVALLLLESWPAIFVVGFRGGTCARRGAPAVLALWGRLRRRGAGGETPPDPPACAWVTGGVAARWPRAKARNPRECIQPMDQS